MASCDAANLFGWLVGSGSGLAADIVIIVLVAMSPALGPGRTTPDRWNGLRRHLKRSLWLLLPIWCAGAYVGHVFLVCYADGLASSAAIMIGIVLLLAMVTAANQIGRRSVR